MKKRNNLPNPRKVILFLISLASRAALLQGVSVAETPQLHPPVVWDAEKLKTMELPLRDPKNSPVHIPPEYYYSIPEVKIYKSYPIYMPGSEPAGYMDWLRMQDPEVIFDDSKLHTEQEWTDAGKLVFDAPLYFDTVITPKQVARLDWYRESNVPVLPNGIIPFYRYVIRKKGMIAVGRQPCASCHTRVLADGTVITGAQGNIPFDRTQADMLVNYLKPAQALDYMLTNYATPFLRGDPHAQLAHMSPTDLANLLRAIPPGVMARANASPFYPTQVPDLIGVKDRRYLDHTGLFQHREIGDLMRYAALVQSAGVLDRYGDFRIVPDLPPIDKLDRYADQLRRYSDAQLYALSLYVYSLRPPRNPNQMDSKAHRGQEVFLRAGCGGCHPPPLYTNNKLLPVDDFVVPTEHRTKYNIADISIGTDSGLTTYTRKGTGYYKVPSLRGVWYRGPFSHDGAVATLDDWFDPRRLQDSYTPTGFVGYGITHRAVKGHPYGLTLPPGDKAALIAFLRTL